jgi:methylated-DNA-[protein]-cysteine S-methyltransferase
MENAHIFSCSRGFLALVWDEVGLTRLIWPEAERKAVSRALSMLIGSQVRSGGLVKGVVTRNLPAWMGRLKAALERYFLGERVDFQEFPISFEGYSAFQKDIAKALQQVGYGRTVSYGELAAVAGHPKAFRAVGRVMATNPVPIIIPCHRVLAAGGGIGGFSAPGGASMKKQLLEMEKAGMEKEPGGKTAFPCDLTAAVRHLRRADPCLAKVISRVGPCRLEVEELSSPFASLMEAIIYQQLTAKAAATISGRVRALFSGDCHPTPRQILYASDEALRNCGLSGAKTAALKDLAKKTLEGILPDLEVMRAMSDEEIIGRLIRIRGIGRWTVEMFLLFRLGRPDILALDDYGLRKGLAYTYQLSELPGKKQMDEIGRQWSPFRSVASWYLWRANELEGPRRASESSRQK